jgi:hypothetical protein
MFDPMRPKPIIPNCIDYPVRREHVSGRAVAPGVQ